MTLVTVISSGQAAVVQSVVSFVEELNQLYGNFGV